ncbi:MAG: hypothetical protein AAGJ55_02910, partial [Cyanobacteria bacterium J06555_12]
MIIKKVRSTAVQFLKKTVTNLPRDRGVPWMDSSLLCWGSANVERIIERFPRLTAALLPRDDAHRSEPEHLTR